MPLAYALKDVLQLVNSYSSHARYIIIIYLNLPTQTKVSDPA